LQLFTKAHTCSKQLCGQCHKRHHTLHHINKQIQTTNDKGSTTNNNHSANAKSTTAEINTYCSLKSKSRNNILLATAIVDVKNKSGQYVSCRALLDRGSQSHFITERCVQSLRLSRTQTHASIQGISNVNTATQHSVSMYLRSRHSDWHTTLDCAILSSITGTTPPSKLDTTSWKIPKGIKLADEQFDQQGSIDLLIGAGLVYEILQSGRRMRPGNFPVLQDTVLGWTISGRNRDTNQNEAQSTYLSREDNSLKSNLKRFWEVKAVELSTMTAEQQTCEELPNKMGPNPINTSSVSEETDHSDSAKFQEGRKTIYCLTYPVFKAKGSTIIRTWITPKGGAKPSNGTQHEN